MGTGPSKESVWQYFVNKSANNLHIVLGMSPVGDTLRTRCRNFPGESQHSMDDLLLLCLLIFHFFDQDALLYFSLSLRPRKQHRDRLVPAMAATGLTRSGLLFPGSVAKYE